MKETKKTLKKKLNLQQFKAILKKDLSLLFRKKIAFFIFGGPFLLMFFMFIIPTLFSTSTQLNLLIYNEDQGYMDQNIGDLIVQSLNLYYSSNDSLVSVILVDNYSAILKTEDLGLYIPSNFSTLAFSSSPSLYIVDTLQTITSQTQISIIYNICQKVMTTAIANRSIPDIQTVQVSPVSGTGEQSLSVKASIVAYPLGYMIFLLIALNSSSNSLIGFAREKRMRTMEIMLAYTINHRSLIISKVITGVVASVGSTLSYFLGVGAAALIINRNSETNFFDIFSLNLNLLNFWDILLVILSVIVALFLSTLMTMAVDCNLTREASERLSPLISIGFSFFFYFLIIVNPFAFSTALMINPFYWPYRLVLLVVSKKFTIEVIIYIIEIISLTFILIYFATRGIEKEKNLYLE
ncbi:MAG: ABC transporter permease [Candidatus Heimdallarchaeum aukensis]|uniref:ABC transporter permease n=1 Tax=Candidatus Heimdallarchaeum aukensis TaxID=2876573 RepID=A0A9Y1BM99_9ARCH|nr:MAG: ABC transporter permease [Candidatus Heimdallarchaeum aukensis]